MPKEIRSTNSEGPDGSAVAMLQRPLRHSDFVLRASLDIRHSSLDISPHFSPSRPKQPRDKIPPMAQLKDFPKVVRSLGFIPFAKKVWSEVNQDEVFTWGSALAYSWIFAIFPFLIFLLTLAPYL